METLTTTQKSNSLIYRVSKVTPDGTLYVSIRLNDECKNGHQDFAITGDLFKTGKPKADRYFISGGCIHETILKHFPEFKKFIGLHLCDYKGIPMHCCANGFYHLREGFNRTKPEDKSFKDEFCEYYRISGNEFDVLNKTQNKVQYGMKLLELGIVDRWENEANEAIKELENLTGKEFIVDSKRTQFDVTPEHIEEEKKKIDSGYYSKKAIKGREVEARKNLISKMKSELIVELDKHKREYNVKLEILRVGGVKALNNCIYYSHSDTVGFNWKGYDTISTELINKIIESGKFPAGLNIECDKTILKKF